MKSLAVLALLLGCGGEQPVLRASASPGPSASAVPLVATVPAPREPLPLVTPPLGDAPTVLRERLSRGPTALFFQTFRNDHLDCDEVALGALGTGDTFSLSDPRPEPFAVVPAGMAWIGLATSEVTLHGYSAESLLVAGSEAFYSREACQRHAGRMPPRSVERQGALPDARQRMERADSRRWYHGTEAVEIVGAIDYWLSWGRARVRARFYSNADLAWLRGTGPELERGGLYALALGPDYLQIGADTFCADTPGCAARQVAAAPVLRGQSAAGIRDFAEEFWTFGAPLHIPLPDRDGTSCRAVHLSRAHRAYDRPLLRVELFGQQTVFDVERRVDGFVFVEDRSGWLGMPRGQMGVHGRDQRAFWLNGSPWFFELATCESEKGSVKPVNFRAPGMVTLMGAVAKPGQPEIANEYVALVREGREASCRKVRFEPHFNGGRLSIETAAGVEVRNYDFYPEQWSFWVGPVLGTPSRQRGKMVKPRRMPGGIEMDGVPWYTHEADCLAARRKSGSQAPKATVKK
jgi:hypothetical protein